MFTSFAQFFTMITTLFTALDQFCRALLHLTTWAEETSDNFNQTARIERTNELHKLRHQAKLEQDARDLEAAALTKPAPVPRTPKPATKKATKATPTT